MLKRQITYRDNSDAEEVSNIDIPDLRIKAPNEYKDTIGIYYIEKDGSEGEGGEFDVNVFKNHLIELMKLYHKHY